MEKMGIEALSSVVMFLGANPLDNDIKAMVQEINDYEIMGKRVLVVGCLEEPMANAMAELGADVTGYDLRPYDKGDISNGYETCLYKHVIGDAKKMTFEGEFDLAVSVSVIEHSGLGYYGDEHDGDADIGVCQAIYKALKPGGLFLVTVPVGGSYKQTNHWRRYTKELLKERIVGNFKILKESYFWTGYAAPQGHATPEDIQNYHKHADISAFLVLQKLAEKSNDDISIEKVEQALGSYESLQTQPGNFDTSNTGNSGQSSEVIVESSIPKKKGRPVGWRKKK